MKERATRSFSPSSSSSAGQFTPPFAPPNGMAAIAVFQVIREASALTSSRSTSGWKRTPPLYGPARTVVLDAVAGVDVDLAVGAPDRDLDLHLAVGGPKHRGDVVRDPDPLGREVEVVIDDLEVRDLGALVGRRIAGRLGRLRAVVRPALVERLFLDDGVVAPPLDGLGDRPSSPLRAVVTVSSSIAPSGASASCGPCTRPTRRRNRRPMRQWSQPGSNRRPPACKAGALPTELWPRRDPSLAPRRLSTAARAHPAQVARRPQQCHVREGLREVADEPLRARVVGLGQQSDVVSEREQPLEQLARVRGAAEQLQGGDEPERAGQERALSGRQPVDGLYVVRSVAEQQAVLRELLLDRVDGARPPAGRAAAGSPRAGS